MIYPPRRWGFIFELVKLPFDPLPSIEKHIWQIPKQIISVIKNEVLVFVKTNYFKCLHFIRSQIKVYQISQTYSGTITNRWEKFKTMVISPNTYLFFQKNGKSMEKLPFFKKNTHFLMEKQPFFNIRWPLKNNHFLFGSVSI